MAVWDCFTLNEELLLLEIRLEELADVVDRFVLVEAPFTHQGDPKPLHYLENRERFARWSDQIVHVVAQFPGDSESPWVRENRQRRGIEDGLRDAAPDDLVLVSDIDEIPDSQVVERLARDLERPTALGMALHYYCFDLRLSQAWNRARAARRRDIVDVQHLRLGETSLMSVPNGGWHFSWLGDVDAAVQKLHSFAHTEDAFRRQSDREHVERCIDLGVDFLRGEVMRVVPPSVLPETVRARSAELRNLFHGPRTVHQSVAARRYGLVTRARTRRAPDWVAQHPWGALAVGSALASVSSVKSARSRLRGEITSI